MSVEEEVQAFQAEVLERMGLDLGVEGRLTAVWRAGLLATTCNDGPLWQPRELTAARTPDSG